MPAGKRQVLRRRIAHAHCDLSRAIDHLVILQLAFEKSDPKYEESLQVMVAMISVILKAIDLFSDTAWGRHPDNYEKWRNAPKPLDKAEDMP